MASDEEFAELVFLPLQIAQVYAQDNLDAAKARDSYVRAGEWYKQEEANAYAPPLHPLPLRALLDA